MNKFLATICTSFSIISFNKVSAMNSIPEFSNIIQDNSIQENSLIKHKLSLDLAPIDLFVQNYNISSVNDLEKMQKEAKTIVKNFDSVIYSILHPSFSDSSDKNKGKDKNKDTQYVSLLHLKEVLKKSDLIDRFSLIFENKSTSLIAQNLLNDKKIEYHINLIKNYSNLSDKKNKHQSINTKITIEKLPNKVCLSFIENLDKLNEQKFQFVKQFKDIKYSYDLMSSISKFPNDLSNKLKSFLGYFDDFFGNMKQFYETFFFSIGTVSGILYCMTSQSDNAKQVYQNILHEINANASKNSLIKLAMNLKQCKQSFINIKDSLFKVYYTPEYQQPTTSIIEESLRQFKVCNKYNNFAKLTNWINSIKNEKIRNFKIFCDCSDINLLSNLMRYKNIFPPKLNYSLFDKKNCIKIFSIYSQNYALFINDIEQRYLQIMELYKNFKIIAKLQNEFNKKTVKKSVNQFQFKIKTFFEYVESIIENYNSLNFGFINKSKRISIITTIDNKTKAMNNLISQIINLNSPTQTSSISNLIKQLQFN